MNYKEVIEQKQIAVLIPISMLNWKIKANKVSKSCPCGQYIDCWDVAFDSQLFHIALFVGHIEINLFALDGWKALGKVFYSSIPDENGLYENTYICYSRHTGITLYSQKRTPINQLVDNFYHIWQNGKKKSQI